MVTPSCIPRFDLYLYLLHTPEIKREESSVATGDVTVAISTEGIFASSYLFRCQQKIHLSFLKAQSIITQVSRDNAVQPKKPVSFV